MIKKLSTALLLSGLSTVASAHGHTGDYFKSGFMVGVHGGYSYGHGKFNTSLINGYANPAKVGPGSTRVNKSSGIYGIHGGYLYALANGYTVGGQLTFSLYGDSKMSTNVTNALPITGTSRVNNLTYTNSVKRSYSFIPSINFGKVFAQRYHAYLGLGMAITRFEHEVTNVKVQLTGKTNKTKIGFVPSVGLDYAIDRHFIVGTNLSYEIYQGLNNTFGSPDITPYSKVTYQSKINPRYFNARLNVSYKF